VRPRDPAVAGLRTAGTVMPNRASAGKSSAPPAGSLLAGIRPAARM
jgi:hypothetical protein